MDTPDSSGERTHHRIMEERWRLLADAFDLWGGVTLFGVWAGAKRAFETRGGMTLVAIADPYYNHLRATGSHGWHAVFCCMYIILVVSFGDRANGQRDSGQ